MQDRTLRVRILFAILLSFFAWLVIGSVFTALLPSTASGYLVANIPFIVLAIALLLSTYGIIDRSPLHLASDSQPMRYTLLLSSFVLYLATATLLLVITFLRTPSSISYNRVPLFQRLLFIPVALLLTPIQTSSEELLFRILPIRLFQPQQLKMQWLLVLYSGALFALPHIGNLEVSGANDPWIVLFYYALFGSVLTAISLYSGGFEVALGAHAANNLFVALICNYPASSLPSPSLFISLRAVGSVTDLIQLSIQLLVLGLFVRFYMSKTRH